ncbi:hypothetical protein BST47_14120 [Mycolicibacterium tusciae]|uniref:Alpha/beta-hydrolase catalytic domain-containing protein n=1 Tax=Mycolicibacterium tusciae TaxID=75922 RepID=A0A1X0JRP1_9MYCO|nr:hypothetical protein BST47_14120 [Mycolicibacterium tusciae]
MHAPATPLTVRALWTQSVAAKSRCVKRSAPRTEPPSGRTVATERGEALFEAVSARVRTLPDGQQPNLVVFGESLGSFGAEAAFSSLNNLIARTDGAIFSGPTFTNTMWTGLTEDRDADSPQWLPVYQRGQNVRFAARAADLSRPDAGWDHLRIVYLQHPCDPIAWWDPDLALRKPDWLKEDRGNDALASMNYSGFRW